MAAPTSAAVGVLAIIGDSALATRMETSHTRRGECGNMFPVTLSFRLLVRSFVLSFFLSFFLVWYVCPDVVWF